MIKIKVIFGKAECKAAANGLPYDSTIKEFDTEAEAIAYIRGLNDGNGWERVSALTDGQIRLPDDITDLWEVS